MGIENQKPSEGKSTDQQTLKISHLMRREIQAPIAACLIRGFAKVMGQDKTLEVATEAVQTDAMMAGKRIAEKYGGNNMRELARAVREIWAEDNALTVNFLEETQLNLSFDVIRCRYAELYERRVCRNLVCAFRAAGMKLSLGDSILESNSCVLRPLCKALHYVTFDLPPLASVYLN